MYTYRYTVICTHVYRTSRASRARSAPRTAGFDRGQREVRERAQG